MGYDDSRLNCTLRQNLLICHALFSVVVTECLYAKTPRNIVYDITNDIDPDRTEAGPISSLVHEGICLDLCTGGTKLAQVLDVQNVMKTYMLGSVPVEALRGVSLSVNRGELLSILGPSGSGKSTLLNLLGALDRPTDGTLIIEGTDISGLSDNELADMRRKVGFVFQFFNLISRLDASGNVELPLTIAGMDRDERRRRVAEALTQVGLADRMNHKPSELSGGERQRVAIARALVNEPTFLLMDEPTGNLDSKTAAEIMELVVRLNERLDMTVIVVTHDEEVATRTDRTLRLRDGLVFSDEVTSN